MKNRFSRNIIPFIFVIAVLASCNEKPTEIAFNLLNDTVSIASVNSDDTTLFNKTYIKKTFVPLFNTGAYFVGKYKDYTAISMVRFGNLPAKPDSLIADTLALITSADIVSATMILNPLRYTFGDSISNILSFKVYRVNQYWTNKTNWDTLFGAGSITPYFDYSKVLAEYSAPIQLKDSMISIQMPIDKDLIIDWFHLWAKYLRDSTSPAIWGVALVPDDNSNVIHQFSATAIADTGRKSSTVEVIYRNKNNVLDTFNFISAIETSVFKAPLPDTSSITIQGAVSYRTDMWFDVSSLPPYCAVHSAQLEVYLDESQTMTGNYGLDTLLFAELALDSLIPGYSRQYSAHKETGTNKYIFKSVASAVEEWTRRDGKGSLVFRFVTFDNEYRKMDRMVFYGINNPDLNKRPKLKIVYSTRPQFKKKNGS